MVANYPYEGCNFEMIMHNCAKFQDPKLVEIMSNHEKEASIVVLEKVYYTFLRCSALMSRIEVLQYVKTEHIDAEQFGARKCVKCNCFFYIYCKVH